MVKKSTLLMAVALTSMWSYQTHAAVTDAQAQALGTTLTQFGGEKAGSPDGAIPPYTGGIEAMPGLPTDNSDPFANERPLFSITAANMAQYAGQLTPGAQALLQRYPDYRIDVYPTHRTASYPTAVLQNTVKNATSAEMIGDGDGVSGAYGGIPFPIPQDGNEVMWNSFLKYQPAYCKETYENYLVDSSGAVTNIGTESSEWLTLYYDLSQTSLNGNFWQRYKIYIHTPAAEAGIAYLFAKPIDFTKDDDLTWFYTPGTRRVRLGPEFKYDTPIADFGGVEGYDEIDLFYGRMDKFDFRLAGKKEMIVPYNDFKFSNTSPSAMLGPHVLNPDGVRWERHRVWVVDATLKPGARHSFSRWTFYIDEDSWEILASESYDHANAIYRVGFSYPYSDYHDGEADNFATTAGIYDLSKGNYYIANVQTEGTSPYTCSTTLPNMALYSPQSLSAEGVR